MTVAVVVKVFDGLVLAADSATTYELESGSHQVFNNASKVFELHRRYPIAAMTWGLGNIGSASIATLAKDLRMRLMGNDPANQDWQLGAGYSVLGVAERVREMFYEDVFLTEYPDPNEPPSTTLGLLVAGYSDGAKQAEAYKLTLRGAGEVPEIEQVFDVPTAGWVAYAQPEATSRLFKGIDPQLRETLRALISPEDWETTIEPILQAVRREPLIASMPFADAIALARFLVEVTAQYRHLLPGPDTVGGVVEVAGINRHEGFRWVSRKHYYPLDLNPMGHGHAQA